MAESTEEELALAKGKDLVQAWGKEIEQALKREKEWRKDAHDTTFIYEGEKWEEVPFNILYSNTETLAPALYNSTPRPTVERRFKDSEDPTAKAAAVLCQRTLEYLGDTDLDSYPSFDSLLQSAVIEALVPGRGNTRFKYDAVIEEVTQPAGPDGVVPPPSSKVTYETVCGETVPWNRFLHGYAKKWKEVPWVGYEWPMTKLDLEVNFGKVLADKVDLVDIEQSPELEEDKERKTTQTETKGAWVYEIWDKKNKKVVFVSQSYKDGPLKEVDDPLGLSGFFPSPEPLRMFRRINSLVPATLYQFYKQQAKELNKITGRINALIEALKVRGFYDSTIEKMGDVLAAADNVLIPAENVASMQQGQTLEKSIWLQPIDTVITALQQLYLQRTQIKQVIYEITGIADIMRGSTAASETLGAQEIKNQWGTLRLKRSQKEVARYARDCLRIIAEIAVSKLSPETLKGMTGVPYPLAAHKQQAMMIVQQAQAMQQPPDPQTAMLAQQPSVDELKAMLNDDLQRSYRIDIETNSTVDLEATEDKQDMAELMNAISQFLNGVAPAVEQGIMPFEAAQAMLLGVVRKFRFGSDVEDMIKAMKPPQPQQKPADPKSDPSVIAAQTQVEQTKAQAGLMQAQATLKQTEADAQVAAQEHAFKMQEGVLRLQELQQRSEAAALKHANDMEKLRQQAATNKAVANSAGNTGG